MCFGCVGIDFLDSKLDLCGLLWRQVRNDSRENATFLHFAPATVANLLETRIAHVISSKLPNDQRQSIVDKPILSHLYMLISATSSLTQLLAPVSNTCLLELTRVHFPQAEIPPRTFIDVLPDQMVCNSCFPNMNHLTSRTEHPI